MAGQDLGSQEQRADNATCAIIRCSLLEPQFQHVCSDYLEFYTNRTRPPQGITLLPVDGPDYFTDETPTAVMVRQILGAVSQFEKTSLVQKLRQARERKRLKAGVKAGRQCRQRQRLSPSACTEKAPRLASVPHCGPSPRPSRNAACKALLAILIPTATLVEHGLLAQRFTGV